MPVMKDKLKRRHVQWFIILRQKKDPKLERLYIDELAKVYGSRKVHTHLSVNRCAYYALKSYYHTTSVEQLCEVLGL